MRPSVRACIFPGSDLKNCSMYFPVTLHDDRPIGHIDVVLKKIKMADLCWILDIFTYKSSLSIVRLPKFTEMLSWGNILHPVYFR